MDGVLNSTSCELAQTSAGHRVTFAYFWCIIRSGYLISGSVSEVGENITGRTSGESGGGGKSLPLRKRLAVHALCFACSVGISTFSVTSGMYGGIAGCALFPQGTGRGISSVLLLLAGSFVNGVIYQGAFGGSFRKNFIKGFAMMLAVSLLLLGTCVLLLAPFSNM